MKKTILSLIVLIGIGLSIILIQVIGINSKASNYEDLMTAYALYPVFPFNNTLTEIINSKEIPNSEKIARYLIKSNFQIMGISNRMNSLKEDDYKDKSLLFLKKVSILINNSIPKILESKTMRSSLVDLKKSLEKEILLFSKFKTMKETEKFYKDLTKKVIKKNVKKNILTNFKI